MGPSSTDRSAVVIRSFIGVLLNVALIGLIAIVVLTEAVGPIAILTGHTPFIIGGGSMSPAIPRGSLVIVEPAARPLEAGEVGTFRTPAGVAVTHRVTRVVYRSDGTWFETKGDANVHADPALWPETSVVGRVVVAAPGLGYVSWLLRTPLGWLNVLALAAWLLMARRLIQVRAASSAEPAGSPVQQSAAQPVEAVPGTAALRRKARA
jgi:signal peptidase I